MKQLILSFVTFISLAALAQDNKKDPNATERTLSGSFTAITITDGIDVYLTQGQSESIAVTAADEKYMERFKTEVENGTLKIYYDNKGINWAFNEKRKLRAWVSFKNLEKLKVSGGATVKTNNAMDVDKLEMKFTSGSHFDGQVNAKELDVDQSSGSGITISGRADKIKVEGNSGSIFKGYELAVRWLIERAEA